MEGLKQPVLEQLNTVEELDIKDQVLEAVEVALLPEQSQMELPLHRLLEQLL
jgi:hypothetical protein